MGTPPFLDFGKDPLKPVLVDRVRFDPAAFIPDDVFVSELRDGLNFFHGWVLAQRIFFLMSAELCVQLHFFKGI
jgi:hypothetical protein